MKPNPLNVGDIVSFEGSKQQHEVISVNGTSATFRRISDKKAQEKLNLIGKVNRALVLRFKGLHANVSN